MKTNPKIDKYFVNKTPELFYYFDQDITAKEFANYLTEQGFDSIVIDPCTVSVNVLDDDDNIRRVTIKRGQYWSINYSWYSTYTQEDMDEDFTLIANYEYA